MILSLLLISILKVLASNDPGCYYHTFMISCSTGCYKNGRFCKRCDSTCFDCMFQSDFCTECNGTRYLVNNECKECSTSFGKNCRKCDEESGCTDCPSGNQMNSKICQPCNNFDPNCLLCSNNQCQSCSNGFYIANNGKCNSCLKNTATLGNNCLECISNVCYKCSNGSPGQYTLLGGKCVTCPEKYSHCKQCNDRQCLSCEENTGYYYSNGECKQCSSHCLSCSNSNTCTKCQDGYYLSGKKCVSCSTRNCKLCDVNSCFSCLENSYLSKGICTTCQNKYPLCLQCSWTTTSTSCVLCSPGYWFNGNSCVKCNENCGTEGCVSSSQCINCKEGYIFDRNNHCVDAKSEHCEKASNSYCLKCAEDRVLIENRCYPIINQNPCREVLINERCINHGDIRCEKYKTNKCTTCSSNYYLKNDICVLKDQYIDNCSVVTISTTGQLICQACRTGYYPDGDCKKCTTITGCSKCINTLTTEESIRICTECLGGYYFENSLCHKIQNCVENSGVECTKCYINYYVNNGVCNRYEQQLGCLSANGITCTSCKEGFYLDEITNICKVCSIPYCEKCNKNGYCQECIKNYTLSSNSCTLCNIEGCGLCSSTDSKCLECDIWDYKESETCKKCDLKVSNCWECDETGICLSCKSGYYLETNKTCQSCDKIDNCISCSSSQKYCFECQKTHYLENGKCISCNNSIPNCKECTSKGTCYSCIEGYYYENGKCNPCSNIPGCSKCLGNEKVCYKCQEYYKQIINEEQNGYECKPCILGTLHCQNCSINGNCSICETSYTLTPSFECELCTKAISNCVSCSTTTFECNKCGINYGLKTKTKCELCLTLTNNSCIDCSDSTHCTTCSTNYYLNEEKCISCTTKEHCKTCHQDGTVIECEEGYYPNGKICSPCSNINENCTTCSRTSAICTGCKTTHYLTTTNKCISCTTINSNCEMCLNNKCLKCKYGTYPLGKECFQCNTITNCTECNQMEAKCTKCTVGVVNSDGECSKCKIAHCGQCPDIEKCEKCSINYYLKGEKCYKCSDINECILCSSTEEKCTLCNEGYYVKEGKCKECNTVLSNCNKCLNESICTECVEGHYLKETKCLKCSTKEHCKICSTTTNTCSVCEEEYYSKEDKCIKCSDSISNCTQCQNEGNQVICTKCNDGAILKEGKCIGIALNSYKSSEQTYSLCDLTIPNCITCNYTETGTFDINKLICINCYNGFGISKDLKTCINCNGISNKQSKCIECDTNCIKCINSSYCINCKEGYYLRNGICKQIINKEQCKNEELNIGCVQCFNSISDSIGCSNLKRTTEISFYLLNKTEYIPMGYYPITTVPIKLMNNIQKKNRITTTTTTTTNCLLYKYGRCVACENHFSFDSINNPPKCLTCLPECDECNKKGICQTCQLKYNEMNGKCLEYTNECINKTNNVCSKCKDGYFILEGKCKRCEDKQCKICLKGENGCIECQENYILINNKCKEKREIHCTTISKNKCIECEFGYELINDGSCQKITIPTNCLYLKERNECNKCNKLKLGYDTLGNIICSNNSIIDECTIITTSGCSRCSIGFYLNKGKCLQCSSNCKECILTSTNCTTCYTGYTLNTITNTCISVGDLKDKCKVFLPSEGCAICKDGYYWKDKNCYLCQEKCETCYKSPEHCLSCNFEKGFYLAESNEGNIKCLHNSTLLHCLIMNKYGCEICNEGYYTFNKKCYKCQENCTKCSNSIECLSCDEEYILKEGKCINFKLLNRCIKSKNNKCIECLGNNYEVSFDGTECIYHLNLFIIIGIPIIIIFLFIIIFMFSCFLIILIIRKQQQKKIKEATICEFNMKKSNINFIVLNEECGIVINKKEIDFSLEKDDPFIPVNKETRDLICIGNKKSKLLKIQFSTKDQLDKYEIRTNPQLITLKKGKAVEFEIFIKPLCTCSLNESILLVALDMKKGKQFNCKINLNIKTEITSHLDYDELKEEKQIGEGSFGVVYKGTFRGKTVAIKKMKQSGINSTEIKEFEKEVAMLDKFRNEYLVHFYGAVFIPNKICMVNEFCPYGSIQDLINKKPNNCLSLKLKIKFIIDGAKGIEYLHGNGILHRDIKPDNFLVTSIDDNVLINCKLTDFGASRNVNQLMTNMTFTKGIGTPAYMAPEVLDKKHYKYPADIYSFAITMYEIMKWGPAYDKTTFKYPWSIADFVTKGNRLPIISQIPDWLYLIITNCWNPISAKRLSISKLINELSIHLNTNE
ncbi:protein kinase, putative [Entamoeba histolytica HM-1:IMSS-B]|uniref:Protein kinase domain-containing protein n=3 Tax=Entamoeba histolytica TaxID=5759 RepID=A0A175JXZ8_ENTHI|nr:protein kinase, putative [Entamoeba histolytica HM-1:IMSS-B]ENY64683.1 protein serine/threonine kinase, putative [Entamoeba histolytica HM-1:IMSS-A]GAT98641.1 hypothetical protein conserved [Entamoeba histolytica]